MNEKGKPRGRKGGRKPSPAPMVKITVHVPPELRDWLKGRGDVAGQVRRALEAWKKHTEEG